MSFEIRLLAIVLCFSAMHSQALAQEAAIAFTRTLQVLTHPNVGDLTCPAKRSKKTVAPTPSEQEPMVIPELEVVEIEPADQDEESVIATPPRSKADWQTSWIKAQPADRPFRMALWGDSHMAIGTFSAELNRILGLGADQIQSAFIPATMNRSGVRLPVRKTCVSDGWRHESAHANTDGSAFPGPALVNLFSATPNESLAWDLRDSSGQARHNRMTFLFQQTATPIRLALSVDEGTEQEVVLNGPAGPGKLELVGDAALSVVKIRLLDGNVRAHGIQLNPFGSTRLQFDLFGYPGATVAGWKLADLSYFKTWFSGPDLNLVVLAYGTNEGNQKPFNPGAYRVLLEKSVQQMRNAFPNAACLLIAPGDRGILIPKSKNQKIKRKGLRKGKTKAEASQKANRVKRVPLNLFAYSKIHQKIGDIQKEVASQNGCQAWSMFEAMGGMKSSYTWARGEPKLMAPDLIHFTSKGYEQLARILAHNIDWRADLLWTNLSSGAPTQ